MKLRLSDSISAFLPKEQQYILHQRQQVLKRSISFNYLSWLLDYDFLSDCFGSDINIRDKLFLFSFLDFIDWELFITIKSDWTPFGPLFVECKRCFMNKTTDFGSSTIKYHRGFYGGFFSHITSKPLHNHRHSPSK